MSKLAIAQPTQPTTSQSASAVIVRRSDLTHAQHLALVDLYESGPDAYFSYSPAKSRYIIRATDRYRAAHCYTVDSLHDRGLLQRRLDSGLVEFVLSDLGRQYSARSLGVDMSE